LQRVGGDYGATYRLITDQPAWRLTLLFSYSHTVPQRSQRYLVMVTVPCLCATLRCVPCINSGCPLALRQFCWIPAHESHIPVGLGASGGVVSWIILRISVCLEGWCARRAMAALSPRVSPVR